MVGPALLWADAKGRRMKPQSTRRRCAIYTRKSTDEGLDQNFNSLDAQREACGAYILSQTHEGWEPTGELYDDGGYSGGSMERPGLQQLLEDVEAGKIDIIVNTPTGGIARADGYEIRAATVAADKALFTTVSQLGAAVAAIEASREPYEVTSLQEYHARRSE